MKLHGYYRSSTSYRLRIALELKGLSYEVIPVDLRTSEQSGEAFARCDLATFSKPRPAFFGRSNGAGLKGAECVG